MDQHSAADMIFTSLINVMQVTVAMLIFLVYIINRVSLSMKEIKIPIGYFVVPKVVIILE
jgi:hypothetical protein